MKKTSKEYQSEYRQRVQANGGTIARVHLPAELLDKIQRAMHKRELTQTGAIQAAVRAWRV